MENNRSKTSEKMPVIRIAPVCNGKIYVVPHNKSCRMDLPLMGQTDVHPSKSSNKLAKQLASTYKGISTTEEPRFSVKYASPVNQEEHVYLYILPLSKEDEIRLDEGKFISADEIEANTELYSDYLQKESGLLGMAAELWGNYL